MILSLAKRVLHFGNALRMMHRLPEEEDAPGLLSEGQDHGLPSMILNDFKLAYNVKKALSIREFLLLSSFLGLFVVI